MSCYTLKYKPIVLFRVYITKAFYKNSRKTLTLSKVHLVLLNYKLCIILCILSVTFAAMNSQEYQMLSSHNQFTWYFITCKPCYYEIYISILCTVSPSLNKPYKNTKNKINNFTANNNNCYSDIANLLTDKDAYTGKPCFMKPNIVFIISFSINVPYIDMFLCNITYLYMNCNRITYYIILIIQNVTYGFYINSQVPYFLSLIYILSGLVKLCAFITSLNHVLDIMSIMFFISLLYLFTYIFKLADIMYLSIIHISSVLTKELYIFKSFYHIHFKGISGSLLINNNVVNYLNLIQNNHHFPR